MPTSPAAAGGPAAGDADDALARELEASIEELMAQSAKREAEAGDAASPAVENGGGSGGGDGDVGPAADASAGGDAVAVEQQAGAEALDAVLEEVAADLGPLPEASPAPMTKSATATENEEDLEFSDPASLLGDAASGAGPEQVSAAGEPEGATAAVGDGASGGEPPAVDAANAADLLAQINAELEQPEAGGQGEGRTETEAAAAPVSAVAADGAPAAGGQAVVAAESAGGSPAAGAAIDALDEVLADKAEAVLAETPPTPRIPAADAAATEEAEAQAEEAGKAAEAVDAPARAEEDAGALTGAVSAASAVGAGAKDGAGVAEGAAAEAEAVAAPVVERGPGGTEKVRHLGRAAVTAAAGVLERVAGPLARLHARLTTTQRQTLAWLAVGTLFQATWVWGYVLVRGPAQPPEASGEGTPFLQPGEHPPAHHGEHGAEKGYGDHGSSGHGGAGGHGDGHGDKGKSGGGHDTKSKAKSGGHGGHGDSHGKASAKKSSGHDSHGKKTAKKDAGHGKSSGGHGAKDAKGKKKGADKHASGGHH